MLWFWYVSIGMRWCMICMYTRVCFVVMALYFEQATMFFRFVGDQERISYEIRDPCYCEHHRIISYQCKYCTYLSFLHQVERSLQFYKSKWGHRPPHALCRHCCRYLIILTEVVHFRLVYTDIVHVIHKK